MNTQKKIKTASLNVSFLVLIILTNNMNNHLTNKMNKIIAAMSSFTKESSLFHSENNYMCCWIKKLSIVEKIYVATQ